MRCGREKIFVWLVTEGIEVVDLEEYLP